MKKMISLYLIFMLMCQPVFAAGFVWAGVPADADAASGENFGQEHISNENDETDFPEETEKSGEDTDFDLAEENERKDELEDAQEQPESEEEPGEEMDFAVAAEALLLNLEADDIQITQAEDLIKLLNLDPEIYQKSASYVIMENMQFDGSLLKSFADISQSVTGPSFDASLRGADDSVTITIDIAEGELGRPLFYHIGKGREDDFICEIKDFNVIYNGSVEKSAFAEAEIQYAEVDSISILVSGDIVFGKRRDVDLYIVNGFADYAIHSTISNIELEAESLTNVYDNEDRSAIDNENSGFISNILASTLKNIDVTYDEVLIKSSFYYSFTLFGGSNVMIRNYDFSTADNINVTVNGDIHLEIIGRALTYAPFFMQIISHMSELRNSRFAIVGDIKVDIDVDRADGSAVHFLFNSSLPYGGADNLYENNQFEYNSIDIKDLLIKVKQEMDKNKESEKDIGNQTTRHH